MVGDNMKGRLRSKPAVDSRQALARRVRAAARTVQRSPQLVRSLFREPNVSCAAKTEVYLTAGVLRKILPLIINWKHFL